MYLSQATPHGRFQILAAVLIGLCTDASRGAAAACGRAALATLRAFYLLEVVLTLGAVASEGLAEAELRGAEAAGTATAEAVWRRVLEGLGEGRAPEAAAPLAPVRTRAEAVQVLQLALNPFLAKVHLLLSLLSPGHRSPLDGPGGAGAGGLAPAEEHRQLARGELGLPDVAELLAGGAGGPPGACDAGAALAHWLGRAQAPGRGSQPLAPVLLVLVTDGQDGLALEAAGLPTHVWQVDGAGFDRLVSGNSLEVAELSPPPGTPGRLFCVAYRLSLPVVTGKVHHKK